MATKEKDIFEKQLFSMTTIIFTEFTNNGLAYSGQATGLFYTETTPTDPGNSGPQWHKLEKYWLITNRHVVIKKVSGTECLVDKFIFCVRQNVNGKINWKPIELRKEELRKVLKLHTDKVVDVVAIDISSYIHEIINEIATNPTSNNYILPVNLTNSNLPQHQPITIDVTSDIIVASYPKDFYDKTNKFPIVKSGIVASAWGLQFNGLPMFQIDSQLFPGSSGGLVISKPVNIAVIDGKLKYNQSKPFVFLGVYSGEFTWDEEVEIDGKKHTFKRSYGLGNVWYSYLIPQIISSGVSYTN